MELKLRALVVKDVRKITQYLSKTGLKKTLLDIVFPKNEDNNLPKTWIELRKHLQETYAMTDKEFFAFREECEGNLEAGTAKYRSDFPAYTFDIGTKVVEIVMDIFEDDVKYEETMKLLAYLFEVDQAELENLTFGELVTVVRALTGDSGFLTSLQSSIPQTEELTQVQTMYCLGTTIAQIYSTSP